MRRRDPLNMLSRLSYSLKKTLQGSSGTALKHRKRLKGHGQDPKALEKDDPEAPELLEGMQGHQTLGTQSLRHNTHLRKLKRMIFGMPGGARANSRRTGQWVWSRIFLKTLRQERATDR